MSISRRRLLAVSGALLAAGCTESESNAEDDPESGDDDADGAGSDTSDEEPTEPQVTLQDTELLQLGSGLDGADAEEVSTTLITDENQSYGLFQGVDEETRDAFLEETSFDQSVLVYARVPTPNDCYESLEIHEPEGEDSLSLLTIEPVESEDRETCSQVITPVAGVVRLTFDGEIPEIVRVNVVDGWGDEHEQTLSAA